jgi:ABC-type lipoprotein release transport system permease subunit
MTLGARPAGVGLRVIVQSSVLIAIGLVAGWAIVRALKAPLTTVLFDVTASDAGATASAALILFAASILACLPAAVRAMRVDPVEGLRSE